MHVKYKYHKGSISLQGGWFCNYTKVHKALLSFIGNYNFEVVCSRLTRFNIEMFECYFYLNIKF